MNVFEFHHFVFAIWKSLHIGVINIANVISAVFNVLYAQMLMAGRFFPVTEKRFDRWIAVPAFLKELRFCGGLCCKGWCSQSKRHHCCS